MNVVKKKKSTVALSIGLGLLAASLYTAGGLSVASASETSSSGSSGFSGSTGSDTGTGSEGSGSGERVCWYGGHAYAVGTCNLTTRQECLYDATYDRVYWSGHCHMCGC